MPSFYLESPRVKNLYIFNFERSKKYDVTKRRVIIFVALLLVSFVAFEMLNRSFIKNYSKYFRIQSEFEPHKEKVQLLFLGDSHFAAGIDSNVFKVPAFNLSLTGTNYIASYYLLKHYIGQMPSLKTIVLPVDVHSFSSFRTNEFAKYVFWDQFIDYHELARVMGHRITGFVRITFLSENFGRKSFLGHLRNLILGRTQTVTDPTEDIVEFVEPEKMEDKALQKVKQQFYEQNVFDESLLIYFEKILWLCREKKIRLITVQMPVSEEYLNFAKQYVSQEDLKLRVLENPKYKPYISENFDFMEYYSKQRSLFSWSAWRDGDHLDARGKEAFSALLAKEISK